MAGRSKAISAPITTKKKELSRQPARRITDEEIFQILGLMEQGLSERKACETVGVLAPTFRQAVARQNVQSQYAKALEVQAIAQIQKIEDTIDDMRAGRIDASMARVEIDVRKWLASKMLPRTYGDKLDLTSDGKQLPSPILSFVNPDDDIKTEQVDVKVQENTTQYKVSENSDIIDDINGV